MTRPISMCTNEIEARTRRRHGHRRISSRDLVIGVLAAATTANAAPTPAPAPASVTNAVDSTPAGFSNATLELITQRMMQISAKSWELGVASQALTESKYPSMSVFGSDPWIQNPSSSQSPVDVIAIANSLLSSSPYTSASSSASNAPRLLVPSEGSPADSASTGVAVIVASKTSDRYNYMSAATAQLEFLLSQTPRSPSGAISHRLGGVELWSDSMYMTPPFIAYYGGMTRNSSLLSLAARQLSLYSSALADPAGSKLLRHIVRGDGSVYDAGLWATGNAWAASGTLRVLAAIEKSDFKDDLKDEREQLVSSAQGLLSDAWKTVVNDTSLVQNYASPSFPTSQRFPDSAATALLAYSTYRLSLLGYDPTPSLIPYAESARLAIQAKVDSNGFVMNVVDPLRWTQEIGRNASSGNGQGVTGDGDFSPEAQAFTVLMQAAWKDWERDGMLKETGKETGAATRGVNAPSAAVVGAVVAALAAALWA